MRLPSHHGAASSLTPTTTTKFLTTTTRPRRFHGGGFLHHRCRSFRQRKRLFSTAASKGGLFMLRHSSKMAEFVPGGKPQKSTWHFSAGFVFANDTKVVYPQLPSLRHYGASALAPRDEEGSAVGEFQPGVTEVEVPGEQETAIVDSVSVGAGAVAVAVTEETAAAVAVAVEAVAGEEQSAETPEPAPYAMPVQPLAYKIPDDVFEAARNAPEGSPQSFWSYNLYRGPAGEDGTPGPKVKVHYCTSEHTTERVLRQYFMNEKLLGFDLEWEISATKAQGVRRNVSLFQLASETRIALFHLALYPKKDSFVAPALREIMENPEITKAGVWIKGDAGRVRNFMGVECRGLFELSHLYRLIECSAPGSVKKPGKKLVRMAVQVEEYLHLPLYKGPDVRTSDWSQALGMDQIIYSASDAYAAIHLYAALNHARLNLNPVPPLPHHAELDLPIRLADSVALPAEDEAQEQPVDEDADPTTSSAFAQYAQSLGANHSVEIQDEDMGELGEQFLTAVTKKTPSKRKTAKEPAAPPPPKDPRVEEAELWAKQRILNRPTITTTTAAAVIAARSPNPPPYSTGSIIPTTISPLRAYYLWYNNEDLDAEDVARLLRDPPLATKTVVGYIIKAIQAEKLPYDREWLLKGVLEKLPAGELRSPRYRVLLNYCRHHQREAESESEEV